MSKKKDKIQIKYSKILNDIEVTGSCSLLEIKVADKQTNIMIDCGLLQKNMKHEQLFKLNKLNRDMEDIGYVINTHSHL